MFRDNFLTLKPDFLIIVWFTGSVFITSGKFVDPEITPKFYFTIVFFFVAVTLTLAGLKPSASCLNGLKKEFIFKGFYLTGTFQALYGIFQYLQLLRTGHTISPITGSFENPAGFSAVLALLFPIGLYWLKKSTGLQRIILWFTLGLYILALILSGSRTGLLTATVTIVIFLLFGIKDNEKTYKIYSMAIMLLLILGVVIFSFICLNIEKKASSNGRLLIWKISLNMIREKPFTGHGIGSFKANYMEYQAKYFSNNPDSGFSQLADNIQHPLNEYLKLLVEYGITGFIAYAFLMACFVKQILGLQGPENFISTGITTAFTIFAGFSYPLSYPPIWVIMITVILFQIPLKSVKSLNRNNIYFLKLIFIPVLSILTWHYSRQAYAAIVWKRTVIECLNGKSESMIPEFAKLYPILKRNPYFLYNYSAELTEARNPEQGLRLLQECRKKLADYDVLMLEAENHYISGNYEMAISCYKHASYMVPAKFLPLYKIFEISRENGLNVMTMEYAYKILNKDIKIPSTAIVHIKRKAEEYIIASQDGPGI